MTNIAVQGEVKEEEKKLWSTATFLESKCRRTLDDFKNFCSYVLAYEASLEDGHCDLPCRSPSSSSTASTSSAEDSLTEERRPVHKPLVNKRSHENEEYDSDDESWNAVTCYCEKPFAGRPMIECSQCLTWIHLSCAKIRKSNIPELFVCHLCRDRNPRLTNFFSSNLIKHTTKQKRKSEPTPRKRPRMAKTRKKDFSRSQDDITMSPFQ